MRVQCSTSLDLREAEGIDYSEISNRSDLLEWVVELPKDARIVVDYAHRSKLVAIWYEER